MYTGDYGQEIYNKGIWSKKLGDRDNIILLTLHCVCLFVCLSVSFKTSFKGIHERRDTIQSGVTQTWYKS